MKKDRETYTDEQLKIATQYFIYHVKMYVETLLWLLTHPRPNGWDTVRNAILESHLIHARVLINFLCNNSGRKTDVIASDYFYDSPDDYIPKSAAILEIHSQMIGGQLVHLTSKAMPQLKSEQEWYIEETAIELEHLVRRFIVSVKECRFSTPAKSMCMELLDKLAEVHLPKYTSPST